MRLRAGWTRIVDASCERFYKAERSFSNEYDFDFWRNKTKCRALILAWRLPKPVLTGSCYTLNTDGLPDMGEYLLHPNLQRTRYAFRGNSLIEHRFDSGWWSKAGVDT
jgi:hypothetical protein